MERVILWVTGVLVIILLTAGTTVMTISGRITDGNDKLLDRIDDVKDKYTEGN